LLHEQPGRRGEALRGADTRGPEDVTMAAADPIYEGAYAAV